VEVTKASRYRQHAEECRIRVEQVPDGAQPSQLLKMDKTWDALAEDRDRLAQNHPEVRAPDRNNDAERTA
jgi:hypothetical protein